MSESVAAQMEAAGADLIRCDPGDDPALVLDCARRMATQQVDGWIVVQPGGLGEELCDVGPSEVPLIAISAGPVGCQTAQLGVDDWRAGFTIGVELGRTSRIKTGCAHSALVIVADSSDRTVSDRRVDGIRSGFTSECPAQIDTELMLDAGTQDRAYDVFTDVLTGLPVDAELLVAAVNDGAALGVSSAVPDARAGHVAVAAIGADQRAICKIVADSNWIGDAALFADRYGEAAVPALLDAVDGKPVQSPMYVETALLTAQNIASYYDVSGCPVR